ncbi:DUF4158 domain-containing protein [Nonomuraea sp. NPDC049400]|uniref:DUF4158 domain-containing protein n=1 Tax=Nonomuraea sp. NPDC049400 TaxID=3364352 RepID=UPI0037A54020
MPFEFLSHEQVARDGRFPDEPSPAELEQFFRLDRAALEALATKRRPTMLGWAVQWGTVRMLEVFLTEDPLVAPPGAVAFVAEQLDLDPACLAGYGQLVRGSALEPVRRQRVAGRLPKRQCDRCACLSRLPVLLGPCRPQVPPSRRSPPAAAP